MKQILVISGTQRANSQTLKMCQWVQSLLIPMNIRSSLLDLNSSWIHELTSNTSYTNPPEALLNKAIEHLQNPTHCIVVCPEYNGSYSPALQNLLDHNFEVRLALTQPDRPKGRGKKITASVVKELAIDNNIEVYQPLSFKNNPDAIEKINTADKLVQDAENELNVTTKRSFLLYPPGVINALPLLLFGLR